MGMMDKIERRKKNKKLIQNDDLGFLSKIEPRIVFKGIISNVVIGGNLRNLIGINTTPLYTIPDALSRVPLSDGECI